MTISPRSQWQLFAHSATCEVNGRFPGNPDEAPSPIARVNHTSKGLDSLEVMHESPQTLWKRAKRHYKNRGFSKDFLKNRCASRNGHFWKKKKTKIQNSSYHFFAFFFSFNNKKHKNLLKPYFYSVLANLKKRIFKKWAQNRETWKTQFLHPSLSLSKKKLFLENWQTIGHKKTHKMTIEHQKSPETPIFIVRKWRGPVSSKIRWPS